MVSTSLLSAALLSAALGSLVPPPLSRRALFAAAAGLPALTQLPASALAAGGALSEDAVKQLISQIPLFAVTNKASQPYLTDASEDGIRTGFFFLDPKEALDELRNVRSAADPRVRTPTHPAARGCFEETNNGRHPGGGDGVKCVSSRTDCTARDHSSPTDRGGRATRARAPHARAPTADRRHTARAHLPPPARSQVKAFDDKASLSVVPLDSIWFTDIPKSAAEAKETAKAAEQPKAGTSADLRLFTIKPIESEVAAAAEARRGEAVAPGGVPLFYEESLLLEVEGSARRPYFFRAADLTGTWAQAEFARSADKGRPPALRVTSLQALLTLLQREGGAPPGEASALFVAASDAQSVVERIGGMPESAAPITGGGGGGGGGSPGAAGGGAAAGGPGGSARDRDAALERLVRTAPWGTAASTPFAFL